MCPIISDIRDQLKEQREANQSKRVRRKRSAATTQKEEKPLSKSAYRKQQRHAVSAVPNKSTPSAGTTETTAKSTTERTGKKRATKQTAPVVVVNTTPAPTLGAYLPSLRTLCAIALAVGIVILIRNRK